MTRTGASIAIALAAIAVFGGAVTATGGVAVGSDADPAVSADAIVEAGQTSSTVITADQAQDIDLRATVGISRHEGTYATDDTVNVSVGAVDESGAVPAGVSGINMTVTISGPNGSETTFTRVSGGSGTVIPFSLSGRPSGEYTVRVRSDDVSGTSGYASFASGTYVRLYPQFTQSLEIDRETQIAVQVSNGAVPQSGVTETIRIERPNGTTESRDVTTDADGFATLSLTPTQAGTYRIFSMSSPGDTLRLTAGDLMAKLRTNDDEYSSYVATGQTVSVNGRVVDGGQPAADRQITVRIVNTTDYLNPNPVENITATTDTVGQFAVDWQTPDAPGADFEARLYDGDGDRIHHDGGRISLEGASGGSGANASVDVSFQAESHENVFAPGAAATATIRTSQNGVSSAHEEVTYALTYGDRGVVAESGTVTTNDSGMATVSIPISASAPDGASIELYTAATMDGTTVSDVERGNVQRYRISDDWDGSVLAGETTSYSLTFTDAATGSPVSDVPVTLSAEANDGLHGSVISTTSTTSDAAGNATIDVSIPGDVSGDLLFGPAYPYFDGGFPTLDIQAYDLSIGVPAYGDVTAGDTVTVNYTADSSSTVGGIVAVRTYSDAVDREVLTVERLAPGEDLSVTLPATTEGVGYSVTAHTADENGGVSSEREYFYVQGSEDGSGDGGGDNSQPEPTVSVDADAEVGTGSTTTLSVSGAHTGELSVSGDLEGWVVNGTEPSTLLTSPNPDALPHESGANDTWGHVFSAVGNHTFEVTVTAPNETGTYNFTAESATENATVTQTFTIEVTNQTEHESGVSQQVFDAAAGSDGTLSRSDIVATVSGYISASQIDGVPLSRTDVISLVAYYIQQ